MTKISKIFFSGSYKMRILFAVAVFAVIPGICWATFSEDIEKPKPEFSREGDKITARLIPRGKSTSVLIDFEVSGGKLTKVSGVDFETAARPEVDIKNFKSALFMVEAAEISPPGAEVKVKISSKFFSSSTKYYVFNEHIEKPWMISEAENISLPDFLQDLIVTVKDGGPYDSDGAADGKIVFTGGPRDSFWGYALGTLFIRFFGIFIVLGVLMIGMIISGKIFQSMEKKKVKPVEKPKPAPPVSKPLTAAKKEVSPEMASAVAVALHLHFSSLKRSSELVPLSLPRINAWTQHGRQQIMEERFLTFNRKK